MLEDFINDPSHWRKRAEETRELAKRVADDAARKRLSELATEFDRIALRVEDRINRDEVPIGTGDAKRNVE
jgi:hypothetical protein